MNAPKPVIDGKKIKCPMVDQPRIEAMPADEAANLPADELFCTWERDLSPEAREEYERHFRVDHWEPFAAETRRMLRLTKRIRSS